MASRAQGSNEPLIIVKRVKVAAHAAHHGGAWKVAYADFVTAMMAFFLLMWLVGATTEAQRQGLADYFSPTLVQTRQKGAGSDGLFGGDSMISKDNYAFRAAQTGTKTITVPRDAKGGPMEFAENRGESPRTRAQEVANDDRAAFEQARRRMLAMMQQNPKLDAFRSHIRFVKTSEGLRIDLIDNADFSMFGLGNTIFEKPALPLIALVAEAVKETPSPLSIRGHTDARPFGSPGFLNNWSMSAGRAEATRRALAARGVAAPRFERIEGVAERDPFIADDPFDPRNRRVSVTLLYRRLAA